MSQEKLQAFAEAVSKSEELQKQFASIQMETLRSTAQKLAKLSESAGTPFTAEEYLKSVVESSDELSKEQLQSVAGGGLWDEPVFHRIMNSLAFSLVGTDCVTNAARSVIEKGWDKADQCMPT
jgi:predicted ribosomally synthesized peptide with nif11-like leader